jgi:hypothetical protein
MTIEANSTDINKINISKEKLDLNVSFYFFLKHLVKSKMTENHTFKLIQILSKKVDYLDINSLDFFRKELGKSEDRLREYDNLITALDIELIDVFLFALRLYQIKGLLLAEAKIGYIAKNNELSKCNLLSLTYDRNSLFAPYSMRVNGALLSLIFFERLENRQTNLLSVASENLLNELSQDACLLKLKGIEANQIFMLMFSESINQAITSYSGYNYEDRILKVLIGIGIPQSDIKKIHDDNDKSTEYDFFFILNGKTFGISAKKTLRERYKQFIKTSLTSNIDVSIEITLGLDLNEEKAKIIRSHNTIVFVFDEVYQSRPFLQEMEGVYSTAELTINTLKKLVNTNLTVAKK